MREKWESQTKNWLADQKAARKRQYAAVHKWQGDPFNKKLHATDEIYKIVPRSKPAGSLSNLGPKPFREEIFFEICENNIRVFIFSKIKRSKVSVQKKIKRDFQDKDEIKENFEIWEFIEEIFKLLIVKLMDWDWENPDLSIYNKCYNETLRKYIKT